MKRKTSLVSLLCIFLFVGVLLFLDYTNFNKKALARGEEISNSENLDKDVEKMILAKAKSVVTEQKRAALNIKKNKIIELKRAETLEKGPNYDVDPNDGTDFKAVFSNSVFIGDSISNGLSYYKHLHPGNVFAKLGQNIKKSIQKIPEIKKKNPANIFIMLGMNDSVYTKDVQKFKKSYAELIEKLQADLPNARIYIESVLPVDPNNKKATDRISNDKINTFNDALKEIATEKKLSYIDLRPYVKSHPNFYEPDGIHLNRNFYKYWLKFIQANYLNK